MSPNPPPAKRRRLEQTPTSANNKIEPAELVCFGSIITTFDTSKTGPVSCPAKLQADDLGQLCQPDHTTCGRLAQRDIQLLSLFKNEGIEFDLLWIPASRAAHGQLGALWITIYGSKELASDLGDELQECEVYLQDPIYAERNTVYWNPQKFHNIEGLRTLSLKPEHNMDSPGPDADHFEAVDVLKNFTSEDNLPETEGPLSLRTQLKRHLSIVDTKTPGSHQLRSLTFMIRREQGWQLKVNSDVWSFVADEFGNPTYLNNIDNTHQYEQPISFFGGIIADDMGLGKTLSMISLITHSKSEHVDTTHARRATLVVVPPPLLSNWGAEIQKHTHPGHVTWLSYYGRDRTKDSNIFSHFDIVLTTYHTLVSEWKAKKKGRKATVFTHNWHRVILDEAHTIKNSNTTTALATYDLNAKCRWVVTATPIQNRLSELFSLFQFLRLYPYDANSGSSWDLDTPEQAIERLKRLLGFVMLRRLNHILALPKRTDIAIPLEMNGQDKARYDQARQATIQYLDDILTSGTVMNGYRNAISQINALRIVCNLGCHVDSGGSTPSHLLEKASDTGRVGGTFSKTDEQSGLDEADSTDELPSTCILCGQLLSASIIPGCEDRRTRSANKSKVDPVGRTGLLRCRYCFSDAIGTMEVSQASLSNSQPGSQHLENNLGIFQNSIASGMAFSTKVNALVKDLQAQSQATKSIVFSFWKTSLDLASSALTQAGFTCFQVDGQRSQEQRAQTLKQFSDSKTEAVLLLSLSCGAVGLTLTSASRVYMMEPQWNPAIEEQAMARVYRLGQTQPVVTVRFFMKNSIEEYVREVQRGKKELIDMVFSTDRTREQNKITELRQVLS